MRSKAIRDSARNQPCTVEIVGVCNHDRTTTVLAHLALDQPGIARKPDDLSACYACSACHDVLDGRAPWPEEEAPFADWYKRRAQARTIVKLEQQNIISIKGAKHD